MTIENVINIEDARELRELGLPILPVVDATYSKPAERHFANADAFRIRFYRAFVEHCRAETPTKKRYNQMTKALNRLDNILDKVGDFTSQQEGEAAAIQLWFAAYVKPFVAFWRDVLASGEPVTVTMTKEMFDGWEVPSNGSPLSPNAA
jgi:hypothetical protein